MLWYACCFSGTSNFKVSLFFSYIMLSVIINIMLIGQKFSESGFVGSSKKKKRSAINYIRPEKKNLGLATWKKNLGLGRVTYHSPI